MSKFYTGQSVKVLTACGGTHAHETAVIVAIGYYPERIEVRFNNACGYHETFRPEQLTALELGSNSHD
jgi:hypothetical protein